MRRLVVLSLLLLLCAWAPATNLGGPVSDTPGGAVGTDFRDDPACIGVYLLTTGTTSAAHSVNQCTQGVDPAPDVVWQGSGSAFNAAPPAGSGTCGSGGLCAVDIQRNTDEYFQGDGSSGQFDMMLAIAFTWGCWFNPDNNENQKALFSMNDQYNWELKQTWQDPQIEVVDVGLDTRVNNYMPVGTWAHVVGSYDNLDATTEMGVWFNGQRKVSGAQATAPSTSEDIGIGADHGGGLDLDGQLMECFFFDRELSAAEVCEIFLCGFDGQANGTTRDSTFVGCTCADITTCC
jgi:hypothetical protein